MKSTLNWNGETKTAHEYHIQLKIALEQRGIRIDFENKYMEIEKRERQEIVQNHKIVTGQGNTSMKT